MRTTRISIYGLIPFRAFLRSDPIDERLAAELETAMQLAAAAGAAKGA